MFFLGFLFFWYRHSQPYFVTKRFGKHFDARDGEVGGKVAGSYRARFSGYSEASARDACQALKAKRMACMVVKPT